jgi:CheY-like chemotaxis protein
MKGTLLLIEDSKFIRAASARLLTNAGFTVRIAGDGEEGLRLVQENPPDLILLDMLLPKMGGAQVLQALKQNSVTAHIPVIVLSSLSQQNEAKLKDEERPYISRNPDWNWIPPAPLWWPRLRDCCVHPK